MIIVVIVIVVIVVLCVVVIVWKMKIFFCGGLGPREFHLLLMVDQLL